MTIELSFRFTGMTSIVIDTSEFSGCDSKAEVRDALMDMVSANAHDAETFDEDDIDHAAAEIWDATQAPVI